MIRLLLVAAVIAPGADALIHNGFATQRTWRELSEQGAKLEFTARAVGPEIGHCS